MNKTNEQAKIDAVLDVSKVSYLQSTMFPVTIQTYARDLLEARELIKEMREQLSAVVSTESTPTTKGELVYVNNYIEMRELLEKTKEYAE